MLLIRIKGRGKVKFVDDRYKERRSAKRIIIDENLLALSNVKLPPGHHTFHFEIPIPLGSPQSFRSSSGSIKYEAIIVIPGICFGKHIPYEFHVLSYSPLPFTRVNVRFKLLHSTILESLLKSYPFRCR